jgi:hypothetical protein
MQKSIERLLDEKLKLEKYIVEILDDAVFAERFIAKPNNNRCPSMFKLLETYYEKDDWAFHERPKLNLRATPKQMTRYNFAIDILLLIKDDISENPSRDRKLMWMRANRMQWSKLGRYFGLHRTTIKKVYENVLDKLSTKLKNNFDNFDKLFIY